MESILAIGLASAAQTQPSDPLVSLLGAALLWVSICALLSILSGWFALAQRHRARPDRPGQTFRFASGSLGWPLMPVGYGNCLFVTIGAHGLALSILFPFRILHPPLFIPWSAVEAVERKRVWFATHTAITIAGFSRRLTLDGAAGISAIEAFNKAKGRGGGAGM